MSLIARIVLSLAVGITAGCASHPVNPPLEQYDTSLGYRSSNLAKGEGNTDENYILLALSGGGTRAAAMDYGVLKYLDTVRFDGGRYSLLDEVDIISTSSAASLAAAYYGLYGKEKFLSDFDDDVLYKELQSGLTRGIMNPFNWPRLWSGKFSRSDLAAEYLDKHIFFGLTFADMQQERPMIVLNATDMGLGSQFPFVQGMFDALCSNLDDVLVSRAVTASMAFTPAFTPITLKNYSSDTCGYSTPDWVLQAIELGVEENAMLYARARDQVSYEDIENRPWIHLLDSGIADNMGIRIATLPFMVKNTAWSQADRLMDGTIKRLIIIMVDAKPKSLFKGDLKQKPPGFASSVANAASNPLANYSYETVDMIRTSLARLEARMSEFHDNRELCRVLAAESCSELDSGESCPETVTDNCYQKFGVTEDVRPPDIKLFLLHVSFESLDDAEQRAKFQAIPTALQLPRETVDLLIDAAPEMVNEIPDFHRLVEDLNNTEY